MSRIYCKKCQFPKKACLCSDIVKVKLTVKVIIIQHPKEVKHAKNTARLAQLVSDEIELIDFSDKTTLNKCLESINHSSTMLLYPNENSIALEQLITNSLDNKIENRRKPLVDTIILLDASWPQAFGMWKKLTELQEIRSIHFAFPPAKEYSFRKSKHKYQLSTIEALSHALFLLTNTEKEAFLKILNKRRQFWPS